VEECFAKQTGCKASSEVEAPKPWGKTAMVRTGVGLINHEMMITSNKLYTSKRFKKYLKSTTTMQPDSEYNYLLMKDHEMMITSKKLCK